MGGRPLRSPTHRRHGGPLHRHLPNGTHGHPAPPRGFPTRGMPLLFIRGINLPFGRLVPCAGQVPYALRTRAPVAGGLIAEAPLPLDLHVLGLSLAFILSQDQTLRCMTCFCFSFRACRVAAAGPRFCTLARRAASPPHRLLVVCVTSSMSMCFGFVFVFPVLAGRNPSCEVRRFSRLPQESRGVFFPPPPWRLVFVSESGCKGREKFRFCKGAAGKSAPRGGRGGGFRGGCQGVGRGC